MIVRFTSLMGRLILQQPDKVAARPPDSTRDLDYKGQHPNAVSPSEQRIIRTLQQATRSAAPGLFAADPPLSYPAG